MPKQHIIVVGSGLVGATFIAAAKHLNCRITLLERAPVNQAHDERPISLSYPTIILLQNLGLWSLLVKHATPILQVHVSEQGRLGSLLLKASDSQHDALGYVIPYHLLEKTLYDHAAQRDCVERIEVTDIVAIQESTQNAITFATQAGEQTLAADYVIAADGVNSRCRQLLNIHATETGHGDSAVTALITCQQSHDGTAYERFTKQGVLALLPMWDQHQYRLVWTVNKDYFASLTEQAIIDKIKTAFETRIGTITAFELKDSYPLKTVLAQLQATQHTVLLGDSAHRIYPLAAQGYNLAVRDIAVLIDVLQDQKPLADYVTQRKADQQFTTQFTAGLECIFGLQVPLFNHVRAMGLFSADLLPFVKKRLIRQISGQVGRQPRLLCKD